LKRTTYALLALAFLVSAPLYATGWVKSVAAAQTEAKKGEKVIFVDLFANWCGWCHKMEREVFPTEAFQNATKDMVLLRVNTEDRGEGSKLARDFGVTKLPTFLMLSHDGLVAGVIFGYSPAPQFAQRITELDKTWKLFRKEIATEASFRNDHKRRLSLANDFISRRGYPQAESRLRALTTDIRTPKAIADSAWFHLALSQYAQRKLDEAATTLRHLNGRKPEGEPRERGQLLLGQVYYEQGNYQGALTELRAFKASFPKSSLMESVDRLLPVVEQAAGTRGR
jgi:thioredoxin-related protein